MMTANTITMIFTAELLPWVGVGWGATGTPVGAEDAGNGLAAIDGDTAAAGIAAPQFEQNLTPGAIGDPQFPQNPATYHLWKACVPPSSKLQPDRHANITRL
jgi:hypothetical protein